VRDRTLPSASRAIESSLNTLTISAASFFVSTFVSSSTILEMASVSGLLANSYVFVRRTLPNTNADAFRHFSVSIFFQISSSSARSMSETARVAAWSKSHVHKKASRRIVNESFSRLRLPLLDEPADDGWSSHGMWTFTY